MFCQTTQTCPVLHIILLVPWENLASCVMTGQQCQATVSYCVTI